jgi:protein-L-isoaspartate O-methyltransferase
VHRAQAYFDRPFKQAYVHISAPHMYATVLEALELTPGMSFLNVGSGSGYLSCLAACLLGDCGLSHGIDVNSSVVAHSERCCKVWFEGLVRKREQGEQVPKVSKEGVSFVHGNCFHLDIASSVHTCRYDRIYVGAGCPEARKEFFFSLLADDGILVASINERNELIQVRRRHRHIFTETVISNVIFAPLVEPTEELDITASRPLTFPMLQMRRQRSGTMSSVTTNASTISSVLDAASSARRRSSSVGGETDNSEEQSALLSSLSSSPPSNTISLSASPLTSLLTEASLSSLLRTTHIPNTHLGFSMSMLSTTPPQTSAIASAQNPFVSPYAAGAASTASAGSPRAPDTSRSTVDTGRSAVDGVMQVVPDTGRSASDAVPSTPGTARSAASAGIGVMHSASTVSSGESSYHSPRVVPVRLPPVLWAPTTSRHAQFPQTFKRAVITLLMASRRPVTYVQVPSPNSSSSSAMITKRCLCGAVPMHIWVLIISYAPRYALLAHCSVFA